MTALKGEPRKVPVLYIIEVIKLLDVHDYQRIISLRLDQNHFPNA